jgi:hypothetical protein
MCEPRSRPRAVRRADWSTVPRHLAGRGGRVAGAQPVWLLGLVVWLAAVPGTRAQDSDFAIGSPAWNGLASLQAIAASRNVQWHAPEAFDLTTLSGADGLLLLNPSQAPSGALLARFMRAGGRVALADDFGAAAGALATFDIQRTPQPGAPREHWLRQNRNLLVASARTSHPLSAGVAGLVTNHPSLLTHPNLAPIFAVGEAGAGALLLSGAVGEGRLVALGDPSVLINNMLEYPDNQRFARNLVDYLTQSGKGRLFVVTPATRWLRGQGVRDDGSALSGLRQGLLRMSEADLPPVAVLLVALGLALALLVVAGSALPRGSAYGAAPFLRAARGRGGLAGRVAHFLERPRELDLPLHTFRHELEARLVALAGLDEPSTRARVLAQLERRGARASDVAAARALLEELDGLRATPGLPRRRPALSARRFHELIQSGHSILGALEVRVPR